MESQINFKYEKLPNFCSFCEVIGHAEKFCAKLRSFPNKSVPRIFGIWLSAPTRRQAMSDGDQYFWSNDDDETSAGVTGGSSRSAGTSSSETSSQNKGKGTMVIQCQVSNQENQVGGSVAKTNPLTKGDNRQS